MAANFRRPCDTVGLSGGTCLRSYLPFGFTVVVKGAKQRRPDVLPQGTIMESDPNNKPEEIGEEDLVDYEEVDDTQDGDKSAAPGKDALKKYAIISALSLS